MTPKDLQVKERHHKECKDYRNMLSTILKQSKTYTAIIILKPTGQHQKHMESLKIYFKY